MQSSVKLPVLRHFLNITLALAPLALALAPPWANPSLGDVASSPSPNPSPRRGLTLALAVAPRQRAGGWQPITSEVSSPRLYHSRASPPFVIRHSESKHEAV